VALLEDSAPLREVLGPEFVSLYAEIKRFEHEQFMTVISPWEREHLLLNV
jgi:glutamine synthetase